jgi:hypothetical protein
MKEPPAVTPESGKYAVERAPQSVRRIFASEVPECKGDNCLLTRGSAYVDLSFSGLIA